MIRVMQLADLEQVLGWAANEGWNPGLADASAFLAADADGFFVAIRDGGPVAAISVVNHDDSMAFLGLYLCHPAYRGRGIGYALWSHAIAHAGARTIGLDGVVAQQANYVKSGFVTQGATVRMAGTFAGASATLRDATNADFSLLADLERAANGYDRAKFLTAWLAPLSSRRTVILDDANGIIGFATARLCKVGCKVGPVVAPDGDAAILLVRAAARRLEVQNVMVDVPEANAALIARLKGLGLDETFRTSRMYRGVVPKTGSALQAIGTMELG